MKFLAHPEFIKSRLRPSLILGLLLVGSGCFEESYQTRLDLGVKYYEHVNLLDENLNEEVTLPYNISIRVPKQFAMIPAPPPPPVPKEGEEPVEQAPVEDLRQPKFLSGPLLGLAAAFQATVPISSQGTSGSELASIYLASNHEMFLQKIDDPNRLDPKKFQEYVVEGLTRDLGLEDIGPEKWVTGDAYPPSYNLVEKVNYVSIKRKCGASGINASTTSNCEIYITSLGDIQVLVLVVLPDGIDAGQKITERIALMLETLVFTQDLPSSQGQLKSQTGGF